MKQKRKKTKKLEKVIPKILNLTSISKIATKSISNTKGSIVKIFHEYKELKQKEKKPIPKTR